MITKTVPLPNPEAVKCAVPLSRELKNTKERLDEALKKNMQQRKRLVTVAGPCSADNPQAVLEYCEKLVKLQKQFPELFVVARIYVTKPHSNGQGYKGLCFQTEDGAEVDLAAGIETCRKMMISVLQLGLPVADELLYPELAPYFDDLVSYVFVGARSSEDSLHRDVASSLDVCCGVKNATNGLVANAVNSLVAVASPCAFPYFGAQVQTDGNKFAHIVLRGGENLQGYFANLQREHTAEAKRLLAERKLNDFVMVDLSHANSGKIPQNQLQNARIVASDPNINGVMLESYLHAGKSQNSYGYSKTDECLDIEQTEEVFEILGKGFLGHK